jgi:hypothetical protein
MDSFESRRTTRYLLAVPVSFWWLEADEPELSGQGITQNISCEGVLVTAETCPPAGARIELELLLPGGVALDRGMELHGEGVVVRVLRRNEFVGAAPMNEFAAAVNFYPEKASKATTKDSGEGESRPGWRS